MALSHTDFNTIEYRIENLHVLSSSIPTFSKKTWANTDFPYIQEVDRIETGIDDIANYVIIPSCYSSKIWLSSPSERPLKSFSRSNDYVRWQENLDCIEEYVAKMELRYSGESYSGESIWL